jgi:transcriptional regulator with XRE-family HTH domain
MIIITIKTVVIYHMWSDNPDKIVQNLLGGQIRLHRKNRHLTQNQLADKAGIGIATLVRLEKTGQANLSNFLRVIRALRLLNRIEDALQLPAASPLEQLRKQQGK